MSDPRTDPRLNDQAVVTAAEAVQDSTWEPIGYDLGIGEAEDLVRAAVTGYLRAAREAGADAVTVDGGLVEFEGCVPGHGPTCVRSDPTFHLVPLDGGDDAD